MLGALLVHVPVVFIKFTVEPTHTTDGPVVAAGKVITVTAIVAKHPAFKLYVIVATPVFSPVTNPLAEPTVAIVLLLLVHVPPPTAFVSNVVFVSQIL